ncbi:Succinyl-diaminopimelate desuccinylase [Gammaproteobacteria bacterium]|nr:Succinyl-diaminopimelate desuccinylase [Gammaproteobacteria bacterium]
MTFRRILRAALAVALVSPCVTQSQDVAATTPVRAALDRIRADNAWTIEQQVSICEIPAPPFKEERRAAEMKRRFEALGLRNVRIDSIGNVIAERPGTSNGPVVILAAHLDTVFPEETDVRVQRQGTLLKGPGIGDDCRGLAVLLAVAKAMGAENVTTAGAIYFVANVGEEGPGDLRGVKHLFAKPPAKIDYFISVDGTGLGLTSRAVGSNRYKVSFKGPGGHSYGAFGMPSPIHALGRAIAKISAIQVPRTPKTTFNVGIVEGGTSVNTISPLGAMDVDLRSESPDALATLDAAFRKAVDEALADENARWPQSRVKVTVDVQSTGVRPAAAPPDTSRIVRTAQAAARALGGEAPGSASSTDANWPMSLGVEAITLDGGGEGRGAHSVTESYDDGDRGWLGPQWALMVVTMLASSRQAPGGA